MFFSKKIFEKCRLSFKIWHEYEALEIRTSEQNGVKEVWEGSYFKGRILPDSLQTGGLETCGLRRSRRSTLVHPQATRII